jgi:hypothetical protein
MSYSDKNQLKKRAYNSKVEYTLDKRGVGSSSLPRLIVYLRKFFISRGLKKKMLK